jgi:hypothetical protein
MLSNEHKETLAKMRQELTLIETRAKKISQHFQKLTREVESLKVESLQKLLAKKIKSEARRRGVASVIRDRKRFESGALSAVGNFIIGGLLTQDKWTAVNSGLSGLDGALQGFGRARWVVLLGKSIVVAASENNQLEGKWLAWDSLKLAMEELRKKAQLGEALGTLDDVLSRLEQKRERGFIPIIVVTGQPKPRG